MPLKTVYWDDESYIVCFKKVRNFYSFFFKQERKIINEFSSIFVSKNVK